MRKKKSKETVDNKDISGSVDHLKSLYDMDSYGELADLKNIPIISTNAAIPFQGTPLPFNIENAEQLKLIGRCAEDQSSIILVPLKNPEKESDISNLNHIGVIMKVMKIIDLPDGTKNAFLVGETRVGISNFQQVSVVQFMGDVEYEPDALESRSHRRFRELMEIVAEDHEFVKKFFQELANIQMAPPKELKDDLRTFLNFIIVTSPVSYVDKLEMLNKADLTERAELLLFALDKLKRQIEIKKEIYNKVSSELEQEQREHFLKTQLKTIQNEIGESDIQDIAKLQEKAQKKKWSAITLEGFNKELNKLKRFNPTSPDYAVQYNYLETLLDLPWDQIVAKEIDINALEEDLEIDHYGLEKIKERIVEHVAVLKLKGDMRSPILCLYGPPGVGKTSLCKSIASSLHRDYARISLGGVHDEAQIRGHRRTYIGALPGLIISALTKCESNNPVFVLDEIDKIGNDHRGDPSNALLEVLDPEQNCRFHDNYIDMDYDLSKIFFIATANTLETISAPLRDRMEIIEVTGYLVEEKMEIAKRHLIPKLLENHGFTKSEVKFSDDAIITMIERYTRESGVRQLEKTISRVLRKLAIKKAKHEKFKKTLKSKDIQNLLGKESISPNVYEKNIPAGVVPGLAWTPTGGEILYFESSISSGKGKITLTGNMGDVMKESATIAMQWVRANAPLLGLDPNRFAETDLHLHVPEGAVPKDGPSAGITMVCSIFGSFADMKVKEGVAMTGEATLRGKVLPVGGIKEKILGAKRAGITHIILSEKNKKDIDDIEPIYLDGLSFHYVENLIDVLKIAFENFSVAKV